MERQAPHDTQAEQALLGSLLMDGAAIDFITLEPQDFFEEGHVAMFKAMRSLFEKGVTPDQITVAHELANEGKLEEAGGVAYLPHLIVVTPTTFNNDGYAGIIKTCALNRQLIAMAGHIAQLGYENNDPGDNIAQSHDYLMSIGNTIIAPSIMTPKQLAEMAVDRYTSLEHKMPGIPTGFANFDKTTGGLFHGTETVIAARTGLGKTTFAFQMARQIGKTDKALYVSLETPAPAIIDKWMASLLGKPTRILRRGNYNAEIYDSIIYEAGAIADSGLYLCTGSSTTRTLRQVISQAKSVYGIEVVFVDYLQLLRDRYGTNANERVGYISRELAGMARDFNIALIVLSQLNRAPDTREDKRPKLVDLRESGEIENDADLIILAYRESYYDDDIKPNGAATEFKIAKDRTGGLTGKFTLYWDAHREIYVDTDKEVTSDTNQQLGFEPSPGHAK